jgi:hypothetical protein
VTGLIDADPVLGGLPPPLLLSVPDASQLIFVLRQDRAEGSAVQLVAARNGEGVSTLVRDLCLVAAGTVGLRTLLLAAEYPSRPGTDWTRDVYGMPPGSRPVTHGLPGVHMLGVANSPLFLAAPEQPMPLQAPAWVGIVRELRARFDLVLVDSPALQRSFTGVMLAPHLDTTLMVVAAESTRAAAARNLRDRLAEVGGHTIGTILNKRRFHVPRAAYERL